MKKVDRLSEEDFEKFAKIASMLEPERLSCDGEVSQTEQKARTKQLHKEWLSLEESIGITIEIDEVEERMWRQ